MKPKKYVKITNADRKRFSQMVAELRQKLFPNGYPKP